MIANSAQTSGIDTKPRISFFTTERTIPIVAVSNDGEGTVGKLTLKLIPGNNNVLVNTNPFLDTEMQYSANKAVAVAKQKSDYGFNRDFLFDYQAGNSHLIGGESAGAASTVVAIAALENKTIRNDTAITGTIEPCGCIGNVGEVMEKAKAVSDAGYKRFLVPKGQSNITYYVRQSSERPTHNDYRTHNTRYVQTILDLKEEAKNNWNLDIIEVSTIDDALKNMTQ